jgi:hypothetical protein
MGARGRLVVTLAVTVALGAGCGASSSRATSGTTRPAEDVDVTAASFQNLAMLTRVGDHFVGNLNGHLAETVAVARAGKGTFPVGSVVQLVPFEAMVKRRAGYSPATNDWEFFALDVSAQGTKIVARGTSDVVNRFGGGSCASCHGAASKEFDFICGKDHGCAPLPIGDELIATLQNADPRPKT